MSYLAMRYALDLTVAPGGTRLISAERLVLILLADRHIEGQGCISFQIYEMATQAGMFSVQLSAALAELERMQILERSRNYPERGSLQKYRFRALDPCFSLSNVAPPLQVRSS